MEKAEEREQERLSEEQARAAEEMAKKEQEAVEGAEKAKAEEEAKAAEAEAADTDVIVEIVLSALLRRCVENPRWWEVV